MNKIIILPIVLGSALLIGGAVIFAIGIKNVADNSPIKTNTHEVSDFTSFNIDLDTADLEFKVSTDGSSKVVCNEREKEYHTVEVKDHVLTVESHDDRKWYEKMFNIHFEKMKVTIYVPSDTYGELKIETATGDILVPNDFTFSDMNISVSTGDVRVKSNVTNDVNIKTSTGDISLEMNAKNFNITSSTGHQDYNNVNASGLMNLNASTGHVKMNNVKAPKLSIKVSTGGVKLTDTLITEDIKIKTSTGDVSLVDSDAESLDIETDTGDVNLTLLTTKIFDVRTHTGRTKYPTSTSGGLCKVHTHTGDVTIVIKNA